jgi:tetratricopeptide (TPR) repeat protein
VARSSLGTAAVTCASCGAKIREDRLRCLRCGQTLAAPLPGGTPSAFPTWLVAAAAALIAATIVAVVAGQRAVVHRAAPVEPQAVAPRPHPEAATPAAAPRPQAAVAATGRDVSGTGLAAYAAGDLGTAMERFKEAVALAPNDTEALNNLGQLLVRDGRPAEAIPYFDKAIAALPTEWAYRFNRARAFAVMEQWDQAVAGYRDALAVFPEDYVTYFNLAKALQKQGELAGAIEAFEHAIRLAPGQADFHLSHGLALEAAQRPRDAANAYRRYVELADAGPEADKVKGRIALLDGPAAAPRSEQP